MTEEDHKKRHQLTFLRQVLYTILMMMLMTGLVCLLWIIKVLVPIFRLTVDTLIKMQNDEFLPVTNVHGQQYELERSFLERVIIAAWIFQLLAVVINLFCYLIHPMAVDKSPTSKLFVYIWDKRFAMNGNIHV